MVAQIFEIFTIALSQAVVWFEQLLSAAEMTGIFLSAVFLVLLANFLLKPLFGSAGSDKVRKKKG